MIIACRETQPSWWQIDTQLPDGTVHLHAFPLETLEWRAAEYNIPLDDVPALVDVIVHERFLADPDQALRTARDADEARALHMARIDMLKQEVHVQQAAARGGSVLAGLAAAHAEFATAEHVAAKAEYVRDLRDRQHQSARSQTGVRPPFRSPRTRFAPPTSEVAS